MYDKNIIFAKDILLLILFQINKKTVNIELQSNGKLEIVPSTYHPEFGLSIENKKIIINYNDFLPFETIIKVSW